MDGRSNAADVTMASPPEEKVRLFRALFRGREDVYAKRYVSAKSGKSGYSPACAVEWARGLCDKKRVACAVCPNRRFLPMDDETVRMHLAGRDAKGRDFTLGCYPLLADDSVKFAAIDLDKSTWRSDSASICDILRELGLPIARERSRSGNGAHLWFFFEGPQPARFVRDVLTYVLTLTMERNPEVGLNSYDRIFPNQDRLPKGGFGNLIALPLQGAARCRSCLPPAGPRVIAIQSRRRWHFNGQDIRRDEVCMKCIVELFGDDRNGRKMIAWGRRIGCADAGHVFDAERRKVATRLLVDDANPSQKSYLFELVDNPVGVKAIVPV